MPSSPSEPYRRSSMLSEILSELRKIREYLERPDPVPTGVSDRFTVSHGITI